MRASRCCTAVALFVCVGLVTVSANGQPRQSGTVTLSLFTSFGEPEEGCSVTGFLSFNEGDKIDYGSRFRGLIGTEIPFGKTYRLILKCPKERFLGPYWLSVERADEFVVLGTWYHRGDYYTGSQPRLTVYVEGSTSPETEQQWIKIVGEYSSEQEVAQVSDKFHSARFYNIFPGRFLLLLMTADKMICNNQIDLLGPGARLRVSISPDDCTIKGLAAVKLVNQPESER